MTTGALIFAYNNEQIDYLSMARWSARNIQRHLNIPTAIVTNKPFDESDYEQCILVDSTGDNKRYFSDVGTVEWHNKNRMDAYNLSPWSDRTLVLDADYVVASNQLQTILECDQDFVCHRTAYDVTGLQSFDDLNVFGQYRMPMWWATVMMFRRSKKAETIFDCMTMVRDNWKHYRNLYANPNATYRNDHALSIALNIENGHTLVTTDIPWGLASLTPDHKLSQVDTDSYKVEFTNAEKKPKWIEIKNQDFHAMGKRSLGDIIASNT